ncbi:MULTISPECIES: hypothetical protein, partial [unclassified Colwellia]|uniref:hypothetical protein n=1 Tax=unclassified Colwellia TaxID=196834 RepID=UPI001C710AB2
FLLFFKCQTAKSPRLLDRASLNIRGECPTLTCALLNISHTAVGAPVMLWRFRSIFVVFQMPDSKKPDSFESGFS